MNFSPANVVSADVGRYLSRTSFTAEDDKIVIRHDTRFDHLVDLAKSMSNEGLHGSHEMRLVGLYPPHMPEVCCNAWGITWEEFWSDPKWIKKMLNDPMFADFRIAPGQC
jgi:hypothetical protein